MDGKIYTLWVIRLFLYFKKKIINFYNALSSLVGMQYSRNDLYVYI